MTSHVRSALWNLTVQAVCDSNTYNVQRVNDIGISCVGLYPRDLGLVEERTDRWAQTGPPECQNFWWGQA